MKALESDPLNYNLRDRHINLHSIRAGNRELLKELRIPLPEINFRQNIDLYGSSRDCFKFCVNTKN